MEHSGHGFDLIAGRFRNFALERRREELGWRMNGMICGNDSIKYFSYNNVVLIIIVVSHCFQTADTGSFNVCIGVSSTLTGIHQQQVLSFFLVTAFFY
jgi:hypothetical protein